MISSQFELFPTYPQVLKVGVAKVGGDYSKGNEIGDVLFV